LVEAPVPNKKRMPSIFSPTIGYHNFL